MLLKHTIKQQGNILVNLHIAISNSVMLTLRAGEKKGKKMGKTLAELKGKSVQLRDKIEGGKGTLQDVLSRNEVGKAIWGIEKWLLRKLAVCLLLLLLGGCSGGGSVALSVGGSIHDPKHPDLANIVEATPIMSTSATKQFSLPMVRRSAK